VLLAARDRSAREIETRLGALGFSAETISSTVDWLREREYLDDRRYAEHYASEKLRAGWARRRILSELLRHGVARGVAEEVVASTELDSEVAGEDAERALVETLVRRFGLQYSRDPAGTRRRITGFIARRGYEWEAAERLMRRFEADERMKG
jgi:regulatory protein